MSVQPEIRFVLVSSARSGTTVTIDLISQHPDAYVHGEVFCRNDRDKQLRLREEFVAEIGLENRLSDTVDFAKKVLGFSPAPKCTFFKMWRGQAPEAFDYLLRNAGVHKIVHVRENRLAQYSSQLLTKATGVSHLPEAMVRKGAGKHERPKVEFDKEHFMKFCKRQERKVAEVLKKAEGPVLRTTYADTTSNGPAEIYEFLGLESFETIFRLQRLNSKSTIDRFREDQHEEILASLDEVGHPEWVSE